MSQKIKAAIFDMDGVIVNTEPIQESTWKNFFTQIGINVTKDDLAKMKGLRSIDVIRLFVPEANQTKAEELNQARRRQYKKELDQAPPPSIAGIKKFINQLKQNGFKVAVATSAVSEIATLLLTGAEVMGMFDVIVTGETVTEGKPNPEIYLTTAKQLGVSPAQCVVFEDALSGVKAAQAAGMKVVAVLTSHDESYFADVSLTVKDFTQIEVEKLQF